MDPFLEDPAIWSGVHAAFLAGILERLGPALRPKYAVRMEERVYLTDETDPGWGRIVPDLRIVERSGRASIRVAPGLAIAEPIREVEPREQEVRDRYIQVIDLEDRAVVTVIEMLSPSNKTPNSRGRQEFLAKKHEVLHSSSHWMEIDLLRGGERSPVAAGKRAHYMVYVSRAAGEQRERLIWPISLRQALPVVGVPLRGGDPDAPLELQGVLSDVIARGSYDLDTDRTRALNPPLSAEDAEWVRGILSAHAED